MKKVIDKLKALVPTKRKLMQLYLALLFNANLKGFVSGNIYVGNSKVMCAPGVNCYSCPGAIGACPLGSIQGALNKNHSAVFYVLGILVLYAILFGRMICGWACPFGLIEELLYKIRSPKVKKSPVTRILSFFKYVVLVLFVIIVPAMYGLRNKAVPAFCKYICPVGTIEGGLGMLTNKVNESYLRMLGPLFTWKFMLMVSIVVGSIFIFRLFCRFICPLGAFYGIFNKFSIFGVKVDESKCTHCNLCISHCKVDIRSVGDQECINCGECIDVCPTKAISWKGPKIQIKPNEIPAGATEEEIIQHKAKADKKRFIVRICTGVLMLAFLGGVIGYYWKTVPFSYPTSAEIGSLCPSYDLEIIGPEGATGLTIDPQKTGKFTIINFWGTWCGPCVEELPYFEKIATEYAEDAVVIAIHSYFDRETAPEWFVKDLPQENYIGKQYEDMHIIFAQDYTDSDTTPNDPGYYGILGGRGPYPYTLILDQSGKILHIFDGSLHYEDLKTIMVDLLGY